MNKFKRPAVVSNWNAIDSLDDKPFMDGEEIEVKLSDGSVRVEKVIVVEGQYEAMDFCNMVNLRNSKAYIRRRSSSLLRASNDLGEAFYLARLVDNDVSCRRVVK